MSPEILPITKVIIVGGGFGGVRTALDLEKQNIPNLKIVLISDKPHFEYHAALYRVVTGKSPLEVCIPLREIFIGKNVEVVEDSINQVDLKSKVIVGSSGSQYKYDQLVLVLGSETSYFDIPGLEKYSFGFKSIKEALQLKRHIHELFSASKSKPNSQTGNLHFIIVGAGASGTELAGELAIYCRKLALNHQIDPTGVKIDLIEGAARILPSMPRDISYRVAHRLRQLGVNILTRKILVKEEIEKVYFKDLQMKTKTLIWTAGVKPNHTYAQINGLKYDPKGRVEVDDALQAMGCKDVYILGDGAATKYSGMAQTALGDARLVAQNISKMIVGGRTEPYCPTPPAYAVPVGPGWAVVLIHDWRFYGRIGWWLRRIADLRYFLSILPLHKAWIVWSSGRKLCESCSVCAPK